MSLESLDIVNGQRVAQRIIKRVVDNTPISNLSPGSATRALVEALSFELAAIHSTVLTDILGTFLPNATGSNLDFIASIYGLRRNPPVRIETTTNDRAVRFYVRNGTFGDINSGVGFTIPAGARITLSDNITFSTNRPLYEVSNNVTVAFGDTQAFVPVQLVSKITITNARPGTLVKHDFFGYTESGKGLLQVSNDFGLATSSEETDTGLRFRIQERRKALASSNLDALRISVLNVPGVNEVVFNEYTDGAGSFTAYILGDVPFLTATIINEVQTQVNKSKAAGIHAFVEEVAYIGNTFNIGVTFEINTSANDKTAAITAAKRSMENLLNLSVIGSSMSRGDIIRAVFTASEFISRVAITDWFFWRTSQFNQTRFSTRLLNSTEEILPSSTQVLILEPVENSINIIEIT